MTEHKDLILCHLTKEMRSRTCGYWYTILSEGRAHTAFDTEAGVRRFCEERGLTLPDGALANRGEHGVFAIEGSYRSTLAMEDVESMDGLHTRSASNGDYVVTVIQKDPDGACHEYKTNPNIPRRTFDYTESRTMLGGLMTSGIRN